MEIFCLIGIILVAGFIGVIIYNSMKSMDELKDI